MLRKVLQNFIIENPLLLRERRYIRRWVAPTLKQLKKRRDKVGPEPVSRRSEFLEWNYNAELYAFGKRLNEEFRDDLLRQAFTHRSYILQEEQKQRDVGIEKPELLIQDNKALAEIGESFMKSTLERYTKTAFPHFPVEGIESVVNYLLSEKVLSEVSSGIGTKDLILSSDFPPMPATLAATLKALVGALHESSGTKRCDLFIRDFVVTYLVGKDIANIWFPNDPLALLKEHLQHKGRALPEPRLINAAGRNTILAAYQVALYSDKQFLGQGSGESIQIATEMAACDAVKRILHMTDRLRPIASTFAPHQDLSGVSSSV